MIAMKAAISGGPAESKGEWWVSILANGGRLWQQGRSFIPISAYNNLFPTLRLLVKEKYVRSTLIYICLHRCVRDYNF